MNLTFTHSSTSVARPCGFLTVQAAGCVLTRLGPPTYSPPATASPSWLALAVQVAADPAHCWCDLDQRQSRVPALPILCSTTRTTSRPPISSSNAEA